jgi:hypothetical protein
MRKVLIFSKADLPTAPYSRNLTLMQVVIVGLKAYQMLQLFTPNSHDGGGFTVFPSLVSASKSIFILVIFTHVFCIWGNMATLDSCSVVNKVSVCCTDLLGCQCIIVILSEHFQMYFPSQENLGHRWMVKRQHQPVPDSSENLHEVKNPYTIVYRHYATWDFGLPFSIEHPGNLLNILHEPIGSLISTSTWFRYSQNFLILFHNVRQ